MAGARLLRANRWGVGISVGLSALCVTAIVAAMVAAPPSQKDLPAVLNVLFMAIAGGVAGSIWFGRVKRRPATSPSVVRATLAGIEVDGRVEAEAGTIKSAFTRPAPNGGAVVRVTRRWLASPIDVWVPTIEDGRALVDALGQGAGRVASELPLHALSEENLRSRVQGTWLGGGVLVASMVAGAVAAGAFGAAFAVPFGIFGFLFHMAMILRWARSGTIAIGADGVFVRWFSQREHIPLARIERAEVVTGTAWATMIPNLVRLHLRDGQVRDLVAAAGRTSAFGRSYNDLALAHASTVAERINEAVRASARGEHAPRVALVEDGLERGGRAVGEWVAALRKLHDHAAGFREHGATAHVLDSLWSVLEDNLAPQGKRMAAAVALAPHLDAAGRGRVRIAARAVAAPKLRVALEAAAESDDDALVEALAEAESETEARAT